MKFSAPSWSAPTWGDSVRAQHLNSMQLKRSTISMLKSPQTHCIASPFLFKVWNESPTWRYSAMKVSCRCCTQGFFPNKELVVPPQKKKNGNIIHKQQKNYQKLVFGVNKPFPTRTNVHSQFSRLFRNTNGWSCRTWLWIGRCCSPTRLDVEAKNFSKI